MKLGILLISILICLDLHGEHTGKATNNGQKELNLESSKEHNIAPSVEPLPDELINGMFEQLSHNEKINLSTIYRALVTSQTTLRAQAARYLGDHGDKTSVPYLIDALKDDSIHLGATYSTDGMNTTRYWANDSLKKLTGKDFGFTWNDAKEKRRGARARWIKWYLENK